MSVYSRGYSPLLSFSFIFVIAHYTATERGGIVVLCAHVLLLLLVQNPYTNYRMLTNSSLGCLIGFLIYFMTLIQLRRLRTCVKKNNSGPTVQKYTGLEGLKKIM